MTQNRRSVDQQMRTPMLILNSLGRKGTSYVQTRTRNKYEVRTRWYFFGTDDSSVCSGPTMFFTASLACCFPSPLGSWL